MTTFFRRAAAMLPVFLFLLAGESWAASNDDKSQPQVRTEMLTSTQWLADHLNDPNVVVLHVAKDRAEYEKGHIPGARFLAFEDFMVGHKGLMDELPGVEQLQIRSHLRGCSSCEREHETLLQTKRLVATLACKTPRPGFDDDIAIFEAGNLRRG